MGRAYNQLERIAFNISKNGGILEVDFKPPEDIVEQSKGVARMVLQYWRDKKSYKKQEKPSYLVV